MANQNPQDPNLPAEYYDAKIEKLQKEAFYSLLFAFSAENFTFSQLETSIVERLMKEWNISQETLIDNVKKIQKDLVAQQRVDGEYGLKWGSVDPETLVGKLVRLRNEKGDWEKFIIKEYDSNQEWHRIELADLDPDTMEMDDEFRWIDVTTIARADILWELGIRPNFGGLHQHSRRKLI